jgi:hypothetical protein
MNGIDILTAMLRKVASGEWDGEWEFTKLDTADCTELPQELDRLRSDVSEMREACAKICDAIEMSYIDAYDPEDDSHPGHSRAMKAAADCAAQCAAAIRAMRKT